MRPGMDACRSRKILEDWRVVRAFLPPGWKEQARRLGALHGARQIRGPTLLLRALLVHLACGCSLVETTARLREAGWCTISSVSLFHRLRRAEQWLRWLAQSLWACPAAVPAQPRRVRAVDGTLVYEAGRTGSCWRVHFSLNLVDLQCDYFELTDQRGGETLRRLPVQRGDLVLGDRGYGTPPGVAHVVAHGGDALVRINLKRMPLYSPRGRRISILTRLRQVRRGVPRDWPAYVHGPQGVIAGRLIAIRRGRQATERARRKLRRKARTQQQTLSAAALEATRYVFVWTTLPAAAYAAAAVLELYRARWLIEIAIKRMKSLFGLGQLPKRADASARAWLHGKLFVALLVERLLAAADTFSPWGYPLGSDAQPLAREPVPAP
jgi:hypothetical protein